MQTITTRQLLRTARELRIQPRKRLLFTSNNHRVARISFYSAKDRNWQRCFGTISVVILASSIASLYGLEKNAGKLLPIAVVYADEKRLQTHMELDETPVHLDPDTFMAFPSTLELSSLSSSLELTGLGVRTVSFLRVQVYSVGAYFAPEALASLKGKQKPDQNNGEALIAEMLDMPYDVAIRIVPVKNTDHSHLRDGFVRAMLARTQLARKADKLSPEQEEKAGLAIETFKGFFPTGKVPRGRSLVLIRRGRDGALLLEYEDRPLGILSNNFLSKQLMLAYFADNGKEISPKMKTDVLVGLERFL